MQISGFTPQYTAWRKVTKTAPNASKLHPSLADLTSTLVLHPSPLQQVSGSQVYLLQVCSLGLACGVNGCAIRWLTSVYIGFTKYLANEKTFFSDLILFLHGIPTEVTSLIAKNIAN